MRSSSWVLVGLLALALLSCASGAGSAGTDGATGTDAAIMHDANELQDSAVDGATLSDARPDVEVNPQAVPCTPETAIALCGELALCVDDYCCDTYCSMDCDACNVPGMEGTCQLAPTGTVCRESIDDCDASELCDGAGLDCPPDGVLPASEVCRDAAHACDAIEYCDGSSTACPVDVSLAEGQECRPANGPCDLAETCSAAGTCPADSKSTGECRPSAGACDPAEYCDGVADTCGADVKSTAVCQPVNGVCDQAEYCDGVSNACPTDSFRQPSEVCATFTEYRCLGSACGAEAQYRDAEQYCTGSSTACEGTIIGSWATLSTCTANEECTADSSGAICTFCPEGCLLGQCINPDPCVTVSMTTDFESGAAGFTHSPTSGIAGDDPWELGAPSGHGGVGCHSGSSCWATDLNADYDDCEMAELVSPNLDLSGCATSPLTVELTFWHWYNFEDYSSSRWWDGGIIQLSPDNGASWFDVSPSPGYQGLINGSYAGCTPDPDVGGHQAWSGNIPGGAWTQVTVTVAAMFKTAGFRFRYLFGADENLTDWGWLIDDIALSTY